eukprot:COSAG06_NODE_67448_length_252_cov_0.529412_1_plen_37_part_10
MLYTKYQHNFAPQANFLGFFLKKIELTRLTTHFYDPQ